MATQTRRSSGRSNSRSSSSRSGSRSGSSQSTRSSRTRANGRQSTGSRRSSGSTTRSRAKSSNGAVEKTREKVGQLASKTSDVGDSRIGQFASKAKGPLLAGGAALAGLAGGMALNRRNNSKTRNPLRRMQAPSLPKSLKGIDLSKVDLSKVDLDKLTDAAHKVRTFGEQVGDVADAAEKTRKKHN